MTCAQCHYTTRSTFLLEGSCGGQFEDGSQMERLLRYNYDCRTKQQIFQQTIPVTLIRKEAVPVYNAQCVCVCLLTTVE